MKIEVNPDIELRIRGVEDAESFFNLIKRNREYLRQYLGWVDSVKGVPDTLEYIKKNIEAFNNKTAADFGVWYRGEIAGSIGINRIDNFNKKAEIGYWIGEEFMGNGIVTKAVKELISYGFKEMGLNRIVIQVNPENIKSVAIPERLGFIKEGVLKENECVNGKFTDSIIYRMLKSSWSK